ncbi:MAG: hypothetical protein SVR94_06535 [Pseudomonadota bacterium]|nr:hypothetical protein [Pseudomonadota bacterium]
MSPLFSRLVAEVRQNTRLRRGLWLIIALMLSYLTLGLHDYLEQQRVRYQEAASHLTRLQGLAQQKQWRERALQAQELHEQVEAQLWQAETPGLAQATFQEWLNQQIKSAQVDNPRLEVESALEVETLEQLWQVTAKLTASFKPINFHRLLFFIAKNPQIMVIEHLEVILIGHPRFTLVVRAYFQVAVQQ